MAGAIVDSGPLVAFLDRSERHHAWAGARIEALQAPLLICEPVLAEAMYLLRRFPAAQDTLLQFVQDGALRLAFQVVEQLNDVRRLMLQYRDTPMSLADACIVHMAELHDRHAVLTLDSDFAIYRKHDRAALTVIHP